jgi:hypothetical protein
LIIKAANKKDVSVNVYTNQKIIPFSIGDSTNKITIQIPAINTTDKYQKVFNYGIGNWPNDAIANLVANIDSIIIRNSSDTLRLKNKAEMQNYLKKHRSGYAGSVLTIEAK